MSDREEFVRWVRTYNQWRALQMMIYRRLDEDQREGLQPLWDRLELLWGEWNLVLSPGAEALRGRHQMDPRHWRRD